MLLCNLFSERGSCRVDTANCIHVNFSSHPKKLPSHEEGKKKLSTNRIRQLLLDFPSYVVSPVFLRYVDSDFPRCISNIFLDVFYVGSSLASYNVIVADYCEPRSSLLRWTDALRHVLTTLRTNLFELRNRNEIARGSKTNSREPSYLRIDCERGPITRM